MNHLELYDNIDCRDVNTKDLFRDSLIAVNDITGSGFVLFLSASAEDYNAATNTAVGITGDTVSAAVGVEHVDSPKTGSTAYSLSGNQIDAEKKFNYNFTTWRYGWFNSWSCYWR